MSQYDGYKAPQFGLRNVGDLEDIDVSHENERRHIVRRLRRHPFAVPIIIMVTLTALGYTYTAY